jgi:hypothetical protein
MTLNIKLPEAKIISIQADPPSAALRKPHQPQDSACAVEAIKTLAREQARWLGPMKFQTARRFCSRATMYYLRFANTENF